MKLSRFGLLVSLYISTFLVLFLSQNICLDIYTTHICLDKYTTHMSWYIHPPDNWTNTSHTCLDKFTALMSRLLQSQSAWQHCWQEICILSQEISLIIRAFFIVASWSREIKWKNNFSCSKTFISLDKHSFLVKRI